MILCWGIGLAFGSIAQSAVDDQIHQFKQDNPLPPNPSHTDELEEHDQQAVSPEQSVQTNPQEANYQEAAIPAANV